MAHNAQNKIKKGCIESYQTTQGLGDGNRSKAEKSLFKKREEIWKCISFTSEA